MTLRYWQDWYSIWPKKWIFLEPGKAKTTIDSHHAQIAHSINRYVKLGFDISSGKDIENAISGICGTSVSHLEPVRTKEPGKRRNQLPGISNWFEWSWPITGEYAGYIQARDIANLGTWTNFSPKKLEKLQSKTIENQIPMYQRLQYLKILRQFHCQMIQVLWILIDSVRIIYDNLQMKQLIQHANIGIQVKKLKKNHVKEQLETRGILKDIDTNKRDLVKELEIALAKDTLAKIPGTQNLAILFWPLTCGWALKSAQKYGKKGSGKRISKKVWNLLQEYFLEGNVNKSERHTAESMLARLKKNVEDGVIEEEEVPKLETIRNWISRYTSQHHQELAIVAQASKI
ncbi:hypothetical protein RhiirA5_434607 [Rhizophagus irregularis]|uniref:Uncharacterized protein n=1 Tax=Rhizophagus irregularis TaxID=588596 RepID=A0A2N0NPR8_9GLOM|nr:hypothetical protein RhiirA5_434607 [Rhizophagus irregularis]